MSKKIVAVIFLFCISIPVHPQSGQKMVDDAIIFYKQGNYFEAGKRFEQLTSYLLENDPENIEQIFSL